MSANSTAVPNQPIYKRRLPWWGKILVWIVRIVLLYLIYRVIRNPWPLLLSRTFPSLILWIGFFTYWTIVGRNPTPTEKSESTRSTWIHQIAMTVALLLLFVRVPGLNGWFLPDASRVPIFVGVSIQAVAMSLGIWARIHLGRNWSGTVRISVGHELIRGGPYRIIRHPIYTSMLGMFIGTAIASSQYHALVGVGILFVAYIRKSRLEEEILQQTFGSDYEAYRQDSWALIPFVF